MERNDFIPSASIYRKYLNMASIRYNLTLDECRDKYGLFTNNQWFELFNSQE